MRKALLIGIDTYPTCPLNGCKNDATQMERILSRNYDDSPNFQCKLLTGPPNEITRQVLRKEVGALFSGHDDICLLFFAGHGTHNNLGGYLVTPDATQYDEGVPMLDVLTLASRSDAREVVIVLDCCHSGALGQVPILNYTTVLGEGISILSACRDKEYASEAEGGGLFTTLVCDAIEGGAANVCGDVTVASIYAYVDQILGAWQQRPTFKSNLSRLVSLRTCEPAVPLEVLRRLPKYFKNSSNEFKLDPSYEPEAKPHNVAHERVFSDLQKYRAARLLDPIEAEHLYHAAVNSKACKLTPLGQFYWQMAEGGRI